MEPGTKEGTDELRQIPLTLVTLPSEILFHILLFLLPSATTTRHSTTELALCRVGSTCSTLRDVANSDHLWRWLVCDPYWRLQQLPSTPAEDTARRELLENALRALRPTPRKTSGLFDDDEDLFAAPVVRIAAADPRLTPGESAALAEMSDPHSYKEYYRTMPPPALLYTEEQWFDDASRMASLVVHARVRQGLPPSAVPSPQCVWECG